MPPTPFAPHDSDLDAWLLRHWQHRLTADESLAGCRLVVVTCRTCGDSRLAPREAVPATLREAA